MLGRRLTGYVSRVTVALFAISAVVTTSAQGQEHSSFIFESTARQPYTPAYLGNGTISLVTSALALEPARTFVTGVYDHTPGDVPRLASAPAWNEIDINNGSHWLNSLGSSAATEEYSQTLDMYDGVLRTKYVWADGNKKIGIRVEQFVSRDNPELAGVRVTLTPEFRGAIAARLPLRNWPAPHRYDLERLVKQPTADEWAFWYPGHLDVSNVNVNGARERVSMSLVATAPGTNAKIREAVAVRWTGEGRLQTHKDASSAETVLSFNAMPGQSVTLTKLVTLTTSDEADAAINAGWDQLVSASIQAWQKLWETDVIVDGDPKLQRVIHSMIFYLLCSAQKDLAFSIGPMGLSSGGYYGHIFWDADLFMFPTLLMLHPEFARTMVEFRSRTLTAARANAKKNGYQGAMYPWEAGPDGAETTPRFAGQNAGGENHINGDVALAAWQYWAATGDREWLQNDCWPILRDTADFWASRVTFNAQRQQYEIAHVVGVNESQIGVSNDAYTNAVAKKNLELAIAVAGELHLQAHPKWRDIADKMYVPFSESALLWYPLDRHYSPEETREAIANMLSHMKNRVMMGTQFYGIMAADLGDRTAIEKLLGPLSIPFLCPPFQVVAESVEIRNTNFITGAGAYLQQFVFGYTGLRLTSKGLEREYRPVLPPGIRQITLKNISVRGKRQTLTYTLNSK